MPANYVQLNQLIPNAVSQIPAFRKSISEKKDLAIQTLFDSQDNQEKLGDTIRHLTAKVDRLLRCAAPTSEPMAEQYAPGTLPEKTTLVGADGSQVQPDNHDYPWGLVNAAAVILPINAPNPLAPPVRVETEIFLENVRITSQGIALTSESVDLYRDLRERELLSDCLIDTKLNEFGLGLLDGQLELWGSRDPRLRGQYISSLKNCIDAFERIKNHGSYYVGYIDEEESELLVRLLEIALTPEQQLSQVRNQRPLLGLTDGKILGSLLRPAYRSAVFELRTRARGAFSGDLAIFFFYLNVGVDNEPHIVRVELPSYIAKQPYLIGQIQAAVHHQCAIIPGHRYPYILTRAHEEAVISVHEKSAIRSWVMQALLDAGLGLIQKSPKSESKDLTR